MNTTQLRAFLVVAQTGSFSRAAEELHLTQPAVSKRIAQLEAELDIRLLDRIGRQVSLTEAGRALLPRAQRFLDSETACAAVSQGELELAVITLPISPPPELTTVPIWTDPLCFVCGPTHALANVRQIAAKDLVRHPALLPARLTTTREILEQAFAPRGAHIKISLSTNYLETLKTMASIGLGWSLLPRTLVDDSLHEFKVRGVQLKRTLGVVHHRARTLSNAAREMLAALRA